MHCFGFFRRLHDAVHYRWTIINLSVKLRIPLWLLLKKLTFHCLSVWVTSFGYRTSKEPARSIHPDPKTFQKGSQALSHRYRHTFLLLLARHSAIIAVETVCDGLIIVYFSTMCCLLTHTLVSCSFPRSWGFSRVHRVKETMTCCRSTSRSSLFLFIARQFSMIKNLNH